MLYNDDGFNKDDDASDCDGHEDEENEDFLYLGIFSPVQLVD